MGCWSFYSLFYQGVLETVHIRSIDNFNHDNLKANCQLVIMMRDYVTVAIYLT